MKKKVVQLISFSSFYNDNLQRELRNYKDFYESYDLEVINYVKEKKSFEMEYGYDLYERLSKIEKISYWNRFNKYLKYKYALMKGSIVNIQFVSTPFFYLLPFLTSTFEKIVISFWGSDLLRLERKQFFKLEQIIKKSTIISFETPEFAKIFKKEFGDRYNSKIRMARFGISLFQVIDEIKDDDISAFASKYEIDRNKNVVAIGYNRGKEHQHLAVLQAIINECVDPNQIFLVFPWTYGPNDSQYKSEICRLIDGKYKYSFIDGNLTNIEVASLRRITSIMIQVQTTDVMSSSMLETLYSKNKVITGSWLPYGDIYSAGVVMNQVNQVGEVGKMLEHMLQEPQNEEILEKNKSIIGDLYSWNNSISTWVDLYRAC